MPAPTAPSNLQSAAIAHDSVNLTWTDASSDETHFDIERSLTTGSGFSKVGEAAENDTSYVDTSLATATRYFYRIRAVNSSGNSSYTAETSVVTHTCSLVSPRQSNLSLPRHSGGGDPASEFDELAEKVEEAINTLGGDAGREECVACSTNGAVVLDLSKCCNYLIEMTEDINSVSVINSDKCKDGTINISVPPGATRRICGFPEGWGFEGNECRKSITNDSANDLVFALSYQNSGTSSRQGTRSTPSGAPRGAGGSGRGGGLGGAGTATALAITCLTSAGAANSTCSAACQGAKSLKLKAIGGTPPYTWSTTGGTLSSSAGSQVTLSAPANPGSAEAGTAYQKVGKSVTGAGCTAEGLPGARYGCNDAETVACSNTLLGCVSGLGAILCRDPTCPDTQFDPLCNSPTWCGQVITTCDVRSPAMIAANCIPCGVGLAGKVVTVTDSLGTMVSKTIAP